MFTALNRLAAAIVIAAVLSTTLAVAQADSQRLESPAMLVEIDSSTGHWSLVDKASGVRWPSHGSAGPGSASGLRGAFDEVTVSKDLVRLADDSGAAVAFELVDDGRCLEIRWEGDQLGDIRVLDDALAVTAAENGSMVVPCREGLLIRADSGVAFSRTFGTSDYEGCHMNMLGLLKQEAALVVSWDDAYVFPELKSTLPSGQDEPQRLTATFTLRRSARSIRLTPLGTGDVNTLAAGYRRIAESKGLAVTLREKIERNPRAELMTGASNVKLWTCLARRMNDDSTKEESVNVRWTFDEAAAIAEHLSEDLEIGRCLFMLGGWTEGGYDCRHPDNLPANPECGGNEGLTDAIGRIQELGFVASLHDNYQDMYRDAKSFDSAFIEKRPDGSLVQGGRWLGGRPLIVCAKEQVALAMRPQNMPATQRLFDPWSYFIDTTYASGPHECADENHPLDRNGDILWKSRLSDEARKLFGLFGSECGREWALPHSDFFEGLVGVSGQYFHNLDPASIGATVIPFWEMVYRDCQICWGKYGYSADQAAEYVAHHVLCGRPLHYHSLPEHRYWTKDAMGRLAEDSAEVRPRIVDVEPAGDRAFRIRYAWEVDEDLAEQATPQWRACVHFETSGKIRFQDDHTPEPPTSRWQRGQTVETGPHLVHIPSTFREDVVDVYIGLFNPRGGMSRVRISGCDSEKRVLLGSLQLKPQIEFTPAGPSSVSSHACFTRTDQGWAEGLHPADAFLKTTHEVLGPLHGATAYERLTRFEFLTPDRTVRRATYGEGDDATTVVVNFGQTDARVASKLGSTAILPPWGFVVEGPRFAAFYAKQFGGKEYPDGALFTLRVIQGVDFERASEVLVFHGFGDPVLAWQGATYEVRRQRIITKGL